MNPVTSVEEAIVTQQQVIPHRGGNVQCTEHRMTAGPETAPQGVAAQMLQAARLTAPLTQRVQEVPVLLRERTR